MYRQDRWWGIWLGAVGCLVLAEAVRLWRTSSGDSHIFPLLCGLTLVMTAIRLVSGGCRAGICDGTSGSAPRALLWAWGILIGYVTILPWLGYLLSTALAGVLLFRCVSRYRWKVAVMSGVLCAVVFAYLFAGLLKVVFPTGLLGWLRL